MKKIIIITSILLLFSCKKETTTQITPINLKYYGQTTYFNDSSIIYLDSCLVKNDNNNQFWCYNYHFNILIKLDSLPKDKLYLEYKHTYFQTIKIKHNLL